METWTAGEGRKGNAEPVSQAATHRAPKCPRDALYGPESGSLGPLPKGLTGEMTFGSGI